MNRTLSSIILAVSLCTATCLWGNSRTQAGTVPTKTTLTASVNPVVIGQPVTYMVTVSDTSGVPLTGPVAISFDGAYGPNYSLNNGMLAVTTTAAGPPQTIQVIASYLGDANTAGSTSATLSEVVTAGVGLTPTTISIVSSVNPAYPYQTVSYTATVVGGTTPTGTVNFFLGSTTPVPATLSGTGTATITNSYPGPGNYPVYASYSGDSHNQPITSTMLDQVVNEVGAQPALQFVPITPCRVADTRGPNGPLGAPLLLSDQPRSFPILQGACNIPPTAQAYSINLTAVPNGPLGFLALYPTGQPIPGTSLLNSLDGRMKANAAILMAGAGGAVSVVTSAYNNAPTLTNVIIDINGYFVSPGANTLAFYPITPCRAADTRNPPGPLGKPYLAAQQTRAFPLLSSPCHLPTSAVAYSLNVTAIPQGFLGFLTVWPAGPPRPDASTLNAPTGTTTANAAIVLAGSSGAVNVYAQDNTDVFIDVNGYFAPPGVGGTSFYPTAPCRVFNSRSYLPFILFPGKFIVATSQSSCPLSNAAAAYVLNATVVPIQGALDVLKLWPTGESEPDVSTLNAFDGAITSNMAIVPTNNNDVSVDAETQQTFVILDVSGYFAP
jgi:Bacterial Ig-like domain (group 3)